MTQLNTILAKLSEQGLQSLLCGGLKGIEKESLRLNQQGLIAQTQHPIGLGSALTHPFITTDYSEALIELITPPFAETTTSLAYLEKIHQFVYQHLNDEFLLASSMPCGIDGDDSIRIAEYGNSNIGRMKHIYRHGLAHRYGKTMQVIAGIHFNYSVPEALWPELQKLTSSPLTLADFTASTYFGLVRNFQRIGWLILYLFGASPALCKSFFKDRPELLNQFQAFDNDTLYHPYATSLRMSDIGYKSKNQANLKINYNSLLGYVDSLCKAISTPFPDYEAIGIVDNGVYKQLNANILQIENEFYNIIRPKQIAESCERPTVALRRRGVRYIEIRSLDLDISNPIGISAETAYFIEILLLSCLLSESPPFSDDEHVILNANQLKVAHEGRKPGLLLQQAQHAIPLQDWAFAILTNLQPLAQCLDANNPEQPYSQALHKQIKRVENPDLTPSANLLANMTQTGQSFAEYAESVSKQYGETFKHTALAPEHQTEFNELAEQSLAKQRALENQAQQPFDEFLRRYFSQTCHSL